MKKIIYIFFAILLIFGCTRRKATDKDWPQYKFDNYRSAASVVDLDLNTLDLSWAYTASQVPVPAWYGPAKEDAFAKSGPLPSMRDYDLAYYPIIVGDNLYYSSTSDDAVHCINTKNGKEKWHFTTDGPVRVAPTYFEGYLYFGSDDGFVYCIDAGDADLKWKFSPVPERDRLVLQNGRLISFWPVRTGILLEDEKLYFGASLLPWKKSYFCAIDIDNGRPEGEGCYVKVMENMTFEGAMSSTGKKLIQPQGRIAPAFFDRTTGQHQGSLPGTGGCFVLVTEDKHIVHNQNSRIKGIKEYVNEKEPQYMSFKGGKEMVIKGDTSFILSDNSVSAYDRSTQELLWLRRDYQAHRMILSGKALYIGATDTVYAVSTKNGLPLWKAKVEGTIYALATADDALFASTGEGQITCFRSGGKENLLYAKNASRPAEIEPMTDMEEKQQDEPSLELQSGPFVEIISSDSVKLSFITSESLKGHLTWAPFDFEERVFTFPDARHHAVTLPVRQDFNYTYQIITAKGSTIKFEFDNFFNYKPSPSNIRIKEPGENKWSLQIANALSKLEVPSGLAIILGLDDEHLPIEIAQNTDFDVIVLDDNINRVNKWRDMLQKKGAYGRKISALHLADMKELPISSEIANLVWLNTTSSITADQVIRLIAPKGVAVLAESSGNLESNAELDWQLERLGNKDGKVLYRKLPYEISGDWTHQYANPDNSAFGGESFWGSSQTEDFEVQWMGRPGPRFQTDRSGRKPSPLAINGRMFVQGNERIIALDIYNGNILWSKDFSGLQRMNIHRDCSNWAADDNFIYLAIGNEMVKVNQKSGAIEQIISTEQSEKDWGFIAVVDELVLGSSIPENSNYTEYHGSVGWYDAKGGPLAYKVVSNTIFGNDKQGSRRWTYHAKDVIINPTITAYEDQITFVESSRVKLSKDGRGGDDLFKRTWLVSLDVKTGKKRWRKKINTIPGITMYSMAAGDGKYVIVSSSDWKYEIYVYSSVKGALLWKKEQQWFHGDHGGHLSRPAIVNNRLVVKPAHYNLETGQQYDYNVPKSGHGCASYALTEQSIFYRGGSVTQFNFDTREFSRWERLRPDCWISTIPAQGMVLSPEAGGGCSCGNWLETSMVIAPVSRAPITIKTVSDIKPDYKQENWGDYTQRYQPNEFIDSVMVEMIGKPGVKGELRYTIDGGDPTQGSELYTSPLTLKHSTTVKAAIFIEKDGKSRKFIRARNFVRLRPGPSIINLREIKEGKLSIAFEKAGNTGTVYYTIDGVDPDRNSTTEETPLLLSEKTLIKARTIWNDHGEEYMSDIESMEIDIPEMMESLQSKVKQGIHVEYFEGVWEKLPNFDEEEVLKEGIQEVFDLSQRKSDYGYGLRFRGFLKAPTDGVYTLYTTSNDASVIMLHGKLLVDNDGSHGAREMSQDIALEAGLHPIEVRYYQNESGQTFTVELEGPDIPKQSIPADLLFYN